MPEVRIVVRSDDCDATSAYARIACFADYPQLTDTVQEVVVHPVAADGSVRSEWTVRFRTGLLRWTEDDVFDPERRRIDFRQVSGDFLTFTGTWSVEPAGTGSVVGFDASFDLGIPSLAALLDPVATATLQENVLQILGGLLGGVTPV